MAENSPGRHPVAPAGRTYLDVPYIEKDAAKALGARWDQAVKRWYDPKPPSPGLDRWAARPDVPDLLPGEDREFGSGLFVDMVPRTCWFTNVRTCVSPQDWERLRRMITRRAGHRCEICGAGEDPASGRRLEAHERWAYDVRNRVQTLRRLICLCSSCHLTTHIGFANVTGRADEALAHLREVTGMSHDEVACHIDTANATWTARSALAWTLDVSMLTAAGVTLARPEKAADRPAVAERALQDARGAAAVPEQRVTPNNIPTGPQRLRDQAPPQPRGWFRRLVGR